MAVVKAVASRAGRGAASAARRVANSKTASKWCKKDVSKAWLVGINFLYFIVGILFIALSSWGISQKSSLITDAIPSGALVVLVIVGSTLVIMAITGWVGVRFNYNLTGRGILTAYIVLLCITMIMEWASAGVLITFSGRLDGFGPALYAKDKAMYTLINNTYAACCCEGVHCMGENRTSNCYLSESSDFPCNDVQPFSDWLADYIASKVTPVAVIALIISFFQGLTAVMACCQRCKGKESEENKRIGGPLSYDGLYSEGEEAYGGYGYENYVKGGSGAKAPRAGGVAASQGATAPQAPSGAGAGAKTIGKGRGPATTGAAKNSKR